LGERFVLRAAGEAGVGRWRRDAADLHRPFRGVRSVEAPIGFAELADCYRPRLKPGQRFGGRTAMRLWGIPHPESWTALEPIEVMVPPTGAPPRTAGVRGRRLAEHRAETWTLNGAPVVDPVAAFFTCASELSRDEAVVAIDALITTSAGYPGLGPMRPLTTLAGIRERLERWGRFPGIATVRAAIALARERVESPKETQTRLLLVNAGLPEPVVQFEVSANTRFIARVDLAYPELRIALEYEGDGHRTDKHQWRVDIRRQRELEDCGWIVIRLTELDLTGNAADALLARLRRVISARSSG
jgi:hypothetical protein